VIYETTISTIENPAETPARVSEPQFEQERKAILRNRRRMGRKRLTPV